ncbi:integumentary mucin C.1-like isoform X1 [Littorina saxatilis]|uniref:integumentary mucin C.1-like isoform X1 n=1 Tax=Littorina saxatilis TaxID=31220 RepID=UPI0038B5CC19
MCIPVHGHEKSTCVHYPNLLNQPSTTSLTTRTTSATSTVPVTTTSTVPVTPTSTVSVTTISTVPVTTTSTVPVTTTSTVPVTTTSTVPVTTISTVPVTTISTVPVTTISSVPVTTTSTVPVTTTSTVPVTTTSTVPVIEKTCTMDQDCPAGTNTDCYQGLCLCEFGFQYSVSRDECVDFSVCDATDPALTTYLTYPGGGLNGNNNYTTYGSPEECQAICANDSKCHNVERKMSSGMCNYSYAGPTPANWGAGIGWVFYQKNCA